MLHDPSSFAAERKTGGPKIFTFEMHQDDPSKCTSAKMRRLGLARPVQPARISREALVLNPAASVPACPSDRQYALRGGIVVIDCSWVRAAEVFRNGRYNGLQRRLPSLLAGNPTNYAKLASLSSLEAVAATLYIMNFIDLAKRFLSIYKWGDTFLTLNRDPLDEYSKAKDADEIQKIEAEYFPPTPKQ